MRGQLGEVFRQLADFHARKQLPILAKMSEHFGTRGEDRVSDVVDANQVGHFLHDELREFPIELVVMRVAPVVDGVTGPSGKRCSEPGTTLGEEPGA